MAVNDADTYWSKHGFTKMDCDDEILKSYQTDSVFFMMKADNGATMRSRRSDKSLANSQNIT